MMNVDIIHLALLGRKTLKTGRGHRQHVCLFDCILSFSKTNFNLEIIFRCLFKPTVRAKSPS